MAGQEQQGFDKIGMKETFGIFMVVVESFAAGVAVFLRRGFGTEYPGVFGLFAGILILGFAAFGRSEGMLVYGAFWLFAVAANRAYTFRQRKEGIRQHSRYAGECWVVMRLFPKLRTATSMKVAEIVLCLVVGGLVHQGFSVVIGSFIAIGGVALALREAIANDITRKRLQKMRDTEVENRYLSELYRGERDDFQF